MPKLEFYKIKPQNHSDFLPYLYTKYTNPTTNDIIYFQYHPTKTVFFHHSCFFQNFDIFEVKKI